MILYLIGRNVILSRYIKWDKLEIFFSVIPTKRYEARMTDEMLLDVSDYQDELISSIYCWLLIKSFSGNNRSIAQNGKSTNQFLSFPFFSTNFPSLPQENSLSNPKKWKSLENLTNSNVPQRLTVIPTDYVTLHNQ